MWQSIDLKQMWKCTFWSYLCYGYRDSRLDGILDEGLSAQILLQQKFSLGGAWILNLSSAFILMPLPLIFLNLTACATSSIGLYGNSRGPAVRLWVDVSVICEYVRTMKFYAVSVIIASRNFIQWVFTLSRAGFFRKCAMEVLVLTINMMKW